MLETFIVTNENKNDIIRKIHEFLSNNKIMRFENYESDSGIYSFDKNKQCGITIVDDKLFINKVNGYSEIWYPFVGTINNFNESYICIFDKFMNSRFILYNDDKITFNDNYMILHTQPLTNYKESINYLSKWGKGIFCKKEYNNIEYNDYIIRQLYDNYYSYYYSLTNIDDIELQFIGEKIIDLVYTDIKKKINFNNNIFESEIKYKNYYIKYVFNLYKYIKDGKDFIDIKYYIRNKKFNNIDSLITYITEGINE